MVTAPSLNSNGKQNGQKEDRKKLLQSVKSNVHRQLIDRLDLGQINDGNMDEVKQEIRPLILELIAGYGLPLSGQERSGIVDEVIDEVFGFGPLEPLLKDTSISDILINNAQEVFIEKMGKLQQASISFRDDKHLLQIIDRIVSRIGRRIDETSPMVDARLPDGSRVNAIIPPLALNGPAMSIRRFGANPLKINDLIEFEALTPEMIEFLEGAVRSKLNIIISGGTGSGKTTLLNILTSFIPLNERIITIEDSAELIIQQPHVVRLETRPSNIEGHGAVTQRDLLFNTLRMRPDRIILGETRGPEALDMLQAMNTGHEGSLTTIHANNPRDAMSRIEMMVSLSGVEIPVRVVRQQIASAVDIIVQVSRLIDGRRRVLSIAEITGMEGDVISMQEIFQFKQETVDGQGNVLGSFVAGGVRPQCMNRFEATGIQLPPHLFEPRVMKKVGGRS